MTALLVKKFLKTFFRVLKPAYYVSGCRHGQKSVDTEFNYPYT